MTHDHLPASVRAIIAEGGSKEQMISVLRAEGCTIEESVEILSSVMGMTLDDAKYHVVMSETWRDRRESVISLDESFWRAAEELGEMDADGRIHIDRSDL